MASRLRCLHVWSLIFSFLFLVFKCALGTEDFYGILGVSRNANSDEIRKSYRQLAKEWHPDKNTHSDAQEKFIKINEAYKTLSDAKKREEYDKYGTTEAPNQWKQREHHFFQDSEFVFFNGMPFQFQSKWRHGDFTTLNFFKKTILPESFTKPYLIQIVSDWCIKCASVEEIWEHCSRELKSLGLGTARVNKNIDSLLAEELNVRKLPDFVGVISGRVYHYSGTITVDGLRDFVNELFPTSFVPEVNNNTINSFLHHWYDNKPRGLLFTTKPTAPLLLKIVAFKYQANVGIGYVQVNDPANTKIIEKFGARKYEPSFALFKENVTQPEALLMGTDLKAGSLDHTISENLYLNFPRLSSQEMFDKLCPKGRSLSMRSLCVVLFIENVSELRGHALVRMAKDHTWLDKKIRFVYVNKKAQTSFESSIKMTEKTRNVCKDKKIAKKITILWHTKPREVKYTWFEGGWCEARDMARLISLLNRIHSGKVQLELDTVLPELNDEHKRNIFLRLFDLRDDMMYYLFHYPNWYSLTSVSSLLIITFGCVFIVSCMFPSESSKESGQKTNNAAEDVKNSDVLGLTQLNSQTQNNLLHKAKQGQLFIVLLSDAASKQQAVRSPIVQAFANIARLFSRENIFTFGWLSLPHQIVWCNEVMKVQTFGEITPGTVLALNPPKKYLSIFKIQPLRETEDDGALFEETEDEDGDNVPMVFQEDKRTQKKIAEALAKQLPRWLEKLFEGMLPRVKLDKWSKMEYDLE